MPRHLSQQREPWLVALAGHAGLDPVHLWYEWCTQRGHTESPQYAAPDHDLYKRLPHLYG